ncbi:ABC transporter permease [Muricomes intestini]|uniref:Monosaccharide ABC transporter membrane protein (CUT2 family) n=1 Tax=Muricomes intestini TaxID=1796634 RepID=A0A4R3KDS2_9FIRM|nr:ABC transporter permease [Muricomes intestini]TCS81210.1 monosaccharide ABC transporter membrane protein (CUT2 family) [Muricomes intestini]HAX51369.1 ABC transporter permease [Lachnospiraceae bacterium]
MKAKRLFEDIKSSKVFYSLVGLIVLIILSAIIAPNFRTVDNLITIFRQASVLLVLSAGLTAVLLTGGMDLSVGATAGFVGCICAQLLKADVPILAAFGIGILISMIVGIINGLLAGILPSFIATYGTNWVLGGLAIIVMQGAVIYDLPKNFTRIGVGYTGTVPNLVIIALIVVVIIYVLLQRTTFGRQVYAYGSNPLAAKYSAVPVKKIVISSFTMCSMCAGLAGMLITARLNAADAAMGDSYGLQTVAAVVIGGTSMLGGEGGVVGTVIGSLILTIIVNVMNLKGISSFAQGLVVGIVIIAMVLFDTYSKRRQERSAI